MLATIINKSFFVKKVRLTPAGYSEKHQDLVAHKSLRTLRPLRDDFKRKDAK